MSKKYWINSWEYRRIMQILEDYWLTEEHEDLVDIRMIFIKGKEHQEKHIRWRRPEADNQAYAPLDLKLESLADFAYRIDRLREGLNRFIENESKELCVDEDVLWEDLWSLSDERFIKSNINDNDKK